MNFNMKKIPLTNYIYVKMFTTSILRAEKKYYLQKNPYTFKYLKFTFQIVKKSKVQFKYLQVHSKNVII
jgi:hypothetical protein